MQAIRLVCKSWDVSNSICSCSFHGQLWVIIRWAHCFTGVLTQRAGIHPNHRRTHATSIARATTEGQHLPSCIHLPLSRVLSHFSESVHELTHTSNFCRTTKTRKTFTTAPHQELGAMLFDDTEFFLASLSSFHHSFRQHEHGQLLQASEHDALPWAWLKLWTHPQALIHSLLSCHHSLLFVGPRVTN